MLYREEVDGLRALAVIPVILFHAGFSSFSGGFIGVDIFFVISGYLITSIILAELEQNNFSIVNFYERRARRILPALSVVLFVTTVVAYIYMPPTLLKSYSQSLASVSLFSSNIVFYLTNDYFSSAADEMPLLHTWSLAVEEQYYLFFPLLLMFFFSWGRRWLLSIIVFISILSLCWAQILISKESINENFYLIFSRAWELLVGSILAFLSLKNYRALPVIRELVGGLGLSMIVYSIIFYSSKTPFPSVYTLLPVIGTAFVILFSDKNTYVGRLLSSRVFVSIGLLSYSLYLWHQPIFAFLRMKSIGEPSSLMFILSIILTTFLAFLSWKYIENPFRNKQKFNRKYIFSLSLLSIIFFLVIGTLGHVFSGFDGRFNIEKYASSIQSSPKRGDCHTSGVDYLAPDKACRYFKEKVTWAILGDSHAVEPAYVLAHKLDKKGEGLVQLSFSSCPPALLFEARTPGCTRWVEEAISFVEQKASVTNVILAFRHNYYLYGDQLRAYPEIPNVNPSKRFIVSTDKDSAEELRIDYWLSFKAIIDTLRKAGKNVYVLYPIPELPVNINKAVMPFSVFSNSSMLDLIKTTPKEYYYERNGVIIEKLDSLNYDANFHAIKPFSIFCGTNYCPAVIGAKALYFDDNHLSVEGAAVLLKYIAN